MYSDFELIFFENPESSRAKSTTKKVIEQARNLRPRRIASRTPSVRHNAEDLAEKLSDGTRLVVIGGDGQLRTAVEAARLAALEDVVIIPVKGGNSCDGARTYQGTKNMLRGNRFVDLLIRGNPIPVNTLNIFVNNIQYGTAVNYAGIGVTAYSGAAVNGKITRTARKIPGSEHINGVMRALEGIVIGGTVLRHLPDDIVYERNGEEKRSKELLYAAGHSLAGTFKLDGDALEGINPQVVCYEVPSERFLMHLPRTIYALKTGTLTSERLPYDSVTFSEECGFVPIQVDGENDILPPGTTLDVEIDHATFKTLTLAA